MAHFLNHSCQKSTCHGLRSVRVAARGLIVAAIALGVSACGGKGEDTYFAQDVEVLYNVGADRMARGQHKLAAALFDEVERQHPYSVWARRAQLMSAYSYYEANEYQDAILSAERFLALHPGNSSAPYAYYLIANCYYEQISDIGRDQKVTQQAYNALQEVIRRFPETEYARDSQLKVDMTRDHLAGKDMDVGRFYQTKRQYLSSVQRFRSVVENYQTTSHVPEAMHRLVESYLALGLVEEAQSVAAVLGYNYPDSKWYAYSYSLLTGQDIEPVGNTQSWISKILPFF